MIILSVNNLNKAYGEDVILKDVSFSVNAGDRIGIVGRNGAGKSTLLNMITGEQRPDSGEVFVGQNITLGYLKQRDNFDSKKTVIEAIDSVFGDIHDVEAELELVTDEIDKTGGSPELVKRLDQLHNKFEMLGGYTYKSEMMGVLQSMGFGEEYHNLKVSTLSGGERTRLALAALLLEKPDILILDEPTNHLDIETLKWLEQYLAAYKGTILIVSHDRYFLNQVVNRIFDVAHHKLTTYTGNYTKYAREKSERREAELRAYNNQQREIRRQEDIIRIMKEHNTEHLVKRAQSREKRLEMLDRLEKPESEMGRMKIHFNQEFQSGTDVIFADDLAKDFYQNGRLNHLFSGVNLDIKRGEKICIVGPNGVGKTTLVRILMGELEPTAGRLKVGHNVMFGYYDQGQLLLNNDLTVLEELKEAYHLYSDTEMRSILGRFLFTDDDVFIKVRDLSGGEKARLSLVKLMLSGANTLILDEPTNHLDIESKEVFEEALMDFPGTAIIVSHDRYFLEKIPSRILELNEDGMTEFLGNYDYYVEKKLAQAGSGVATNSQQSKEVRPEETPSLSSAEERQLKKQAEAEARRQARKLEETETKIAQLETEIEQIHQEISAPANATNYTKLAELSEKLDQAKAELDQAYTLWEELQQ